MQRYQTIWIGDQSRAPLQCIQTWGDIRVYGNEDLASREWVLREKMKHYATVGEINGVADCMRWELLYENGGTFVDADSIKTRDLPADFDELACIAAWEQEIERPGLIACGYLKFPAGHPFVKGIIDHILAEPVNGRMAWEVVGPGAITTTFRKLKPDDLTILPSHFFYPKHLTGRTYLGTLKYAEQFWGSTFQTY